MCQDTYGSFEDVEEGDVGLGKACHHRSSDGAGLAVELLFEQRATFGVWYDAWIVCELSQLFI